VCIAEQAEGGHHREVDGLPRPRDAGEDGQLPLEVFFGFGVDGENVGAELHFADVDNAVRAVEQKINLRAIRPDLIRGVALGIGLHVDSGNARRRANLRDVLQAEPLEGKATLRRAGWGKRRRLTKMLVP
jgi:hypothetical protein